MIFIDCRDSRPIYEQIADRFMVLILNGVLAPDEKMPSVRSLAMQLSTNPNTVQRAYAELEKQGFLYSVKGKGNYVSGGHELMDKRLDQLRRKLRALVQEAQEVGIDRETLFNEFVSGEEEYDNSPKSM